MFLSTPIFEVVMLICFGISWPFSLYKTYKTKDITNKSFVFLWFIVVGYIAGILNKIFYNSDYVIVLYIINLIMVSVDMSLCYVYKIRSKNTVFDEIRK